MSLEEKLNAIKKASKDKIPAEAAEVMQRATEDLRDSGILDGVLGVGDEAPDFELPNTDGQVVSSRQLRAGGPLVVSFYRGVW